MPAWPAGQIVFFCGAPPGAPCPDPIFVSGWPIGLPIFPMGGEGTGREGRRKVQIPTRRYTSRPDGTDPDRKAPPVGTDPGKPPRSAQIPTGAYLVCVQYMCSVCLVCVQYVFSVCLMYVQCMFSVCLVHVQYMFCVCLVYVQYMFSVCLVYVQCMLSGHNTKVSYRISFFEVFGGKPFLVYFLYNTFKKTKKHGHSEKSGSGVNHFPI